MTNINFGNRGFRIFVLKIFLALMHTHVSAMCGLCVDYVWTMFGLCVDYVWTMCSVIRLGSVNPLEINDCGNIYTVNCS